MARYLKMAMSILLALLAVACARGAATPIPPKATATNTPAPTVTNTLEPTPTAALTSTPIPSLNETLPPLSEWPVYRHNSLGVEVSYPPAWQVDSTPCFVWFNDPNTPDQGFNVANASFDPPMRTPVDFLDHLGPPVLMTETLTLDGLPALLVRLQPVPEAEEFHSVVAVVTSDGRGLTIGGKGDPVIFNQVLTTIRFFVPMNPC